MGHSTRLLVVGEHSGSSAGTGGEEDGGPDSSTPCRVLRGGTRFSDALADHDDDDDEHGQQHHDATNRHGHHIVHRMTAAVDWWVAIGGLERLPRSGGGSAARALTRGMKY